MVHEAPLTPLDGRVSVQANVSIANVKHAAFAAGGRSQNPAILQQLKEPVR